MQQHGTAHLNMVHMLIEARGIFHCTWIFQNVSFPLKTQSNVPLFENYTANQHSMAALAERYDLTMAVTPALFGRAHRRLILSDICAKFLSQQMCKMGDGLQRWLFPAWPLITDH